MKILAEKVAVTTGAARGIGRALADRLAAEGMKVVLADVDAVREETFWVLPHPELRAAMEERFGDILAGVGAPPLHPKE